MSNKHVQTITI